jgi:hypothetical protein
MAEYRLFVAVVSNQNPLESKRPDGSGSLSCFVGNDLAEVSKKARTYAKKWGAEHNRLYRVLVGEITHEFGSLNDLICGSIIQAWDEEINTLEAKEAQSKASASKGVN